MRRIGGWLTRKGRGHGAGRSGRRARRIMLWGGRRRHSMSEGGILGGYQRVLVSDVQMRQKKGREKKRKKTRMMTRMKQRGTMDQINNRQGCSEQETRPKHPIGRGTTREGKTETEAWTEIEVPMRTGPGKDARNRARQGSLTRVDGATSAAQRSPTLGVLRRWRIHVAGTRPGTPSV